MQSYKIIRITEIKRPVCFAELLRLYPDIADRSYAEQQALLFDQAYNYSDSFSWGMRLLGHDAHEIVYDSELLQKTWAKENHISYEEEDWKLSICLAQLKKMEPDIVYLQDIHCLPEAVTRQLKTLCPSIRKLIIFRGHPECSKELADLLASADLLLVGSPILLDKCRFFGLKPHLTHHFFDQRILPKIGREKKHAFTFIGSSGLGYGLSHASRYWVLLKLLKKSSLQIWVDEPAETKPDFFIPSVKYAAKKALFRTLGQFSETTLAKLKDYKTPFAAVNRCFYSAWEMKEEGYPLAIPQKPLNALFPERCHPSLFGIPMYRQLAESKISFNKHSNCAQKTADNIRLFQATGVGSCLLTDACSNMGRLFEPDREVVTYSSFEECLEKVNYLLQHDKEREEIALKGQKRTLHDHTVTVRCQQINELIQQTAL